MINVKDYGAVGDGKTDDTGAIQAALNKGSIDTPVYAPAGNYLVSEQLDSSYRSFVGDNFSHNGGTRLVASDNFYGDALIYCKNSPVNIRGLSLFAEGVKHGILAHKTHGAKTLFENINVFYAEGNGFVFDQCQVANIVRLEAKYCKGAGFHLVGANGTELRRCNSAMNDGDGYRIDRGLSSGGAVVTSCFSQNNKGHGISVVGEAAKNGKYITHVRLVRNWIEGCEKDGIRAELANSIEIYKNRISKVNPAAGARAIRLVQCDLSDVERNGVSSNSAEYLSILDTDGRESAFAQNRQISDIVQRSLSVERVLSK